jgi:hypothetical protein
MTPLYKRLSAGLEGAHDSEWEKILNMHDDMMARVARSLTVAARSRKGKFHDLLVSSDFVVAVLEGQREPCEYNRLVRASVDLNILPTLDDILYEEYARKALSVPHAMGYSSFPWIDERNLTW